MASRQLPSVEDDLNIGAEDEGLSALMALKEAGAPLTPEEEELIASLMGSPIETHRSNLAELVDEQELSRIAQDVQRWVDEDISSRKEWEEREAKGSYQKFLNVMSNIPAAEPSAHDKV